MAIIALATAAAGLLVLAILLVAAGGDEDASTRESDGSRASALEAGDCFGGFRQAGAKTFARAVPCTSSHEGEVVATPDLPILDYPGDARLAAEGEKACRVQASSLYATGRGDEFALIVGRPDKAMWESGERAVTCFLRYTGGPKNFRLEGRWTSLNLLAAGDCVGTWHDTGEVDVVDCTQKHERQVFARLTIRSEKPDEAEVYARCSERARRIFGRNPPADLVLRLGGPNERDWASGQRFALCLAASKKGPLTRSLVVE